MYTYDQSAYNRGSNPNGYQDAGYGGNAGYPGGYQQPRPLGYGGLNYGGSGYQSRPNLPPPSPGHAILNKAFQNSYGPWARCIIIVVAIASVVLIIIIEKF